MTASDQIQKFPELQLILASLAEVDELERNKAIQTRSARHHLKSIKHLARTRDIRLTPIIRSIHNFSCTGGTLIAKCIASMHNTLVLNELNPHSTMKVAVHEQAEFTPTDVTALLRQGGAEPSEDLISEVFLQTVQHVTDEMTLTGRDLVLRDHSHSHYLVGQQVSSAPLLRDLLGPKFEVRSLLTVRDPVDSWLSMRRQTWHGTFSPSTFEEYCRRYLIFLHDHQSVPVVKYEEFVTSPMAVMRKICKLLELEFNEDFERVFSKFRFSGDSGRSGQKIEKRPRIADIVSNANSVTDNESYRELISALSYPTFE
jgi:hypothetical protein